MIGQIQAEIETLTGRKWDTVTSDDRPQVHDPDLFEIPEFDYVVYLRQHGFPSPLLDWSYSPYMATYFAFRDLESKAKSVAIFMYYTEFDDNSISEKPKIFRMEEAIQTQKRHYFQQSAYTVCCKRVNNIAYYTSHQNLYSKKEDVAPSVTKYILPSSEREKALWSLEPYNINAYSLFGTEEGLLETLFLREFIIEKLRNEMYPNWIKH